MTYTPTNYIDGVVLYAAQLNKAEQELKLLDDNMLSTSTIEAGAGITVEQRTDASGTVLPGVKISAEATGGAMPLPTDAEVTEVGDHYVTISDDAAPMEYQFNSSDGYIYFNVPTWDTLPDENIVIHTENGSVNNMYELELYAYGIKSRSQALPDYSNAEFTCGEPEEDGDDPGLYMSKGTYYTFYDLKEIYAESADGTDVAYFELRADPTDDISYQLLNAGMLVAGTGVTIEQATDTTGTPLRALKISASAGNALPLPADATTSVDDVNEVVTVEVPRIAEWKLGNEDGTRFAEIRTPGQASVHADNDSLAFYCESTYSSGSMVYGGLSAGAFSIGMDGTYCFDLAMSEGGINMSYDTYDNTLYSTADRIHVVNKDDDTIDATFEYLSDPTNEDSWVNQILTPAFIQAGAGITIEQATDASGDAIRGIKLSSSGGGLPYPSTCTVDTSETFNSIKIDYSPTGTQEAEAFLKAVPKFRLSASGTYELAPGMEITQSVEGVIAGDSIEMENTFSSSLFPTDMESGVKLQAEKLNLAAINGSFDGHVYATLSCEDQQLIFQNDVYDGTSDFDVVSTTTYSQNGIEYVEGSSSVAYRFDGHADGTEILKPDYVEAGSGVTIEERTDASGNTIPGIKISASGGITIPEDASSYVDNNDRTSVVYFGFTGVQATDIQGKLPKLMLRSSGDLTYSGVPLTGNIFSVLDTDASLGIKSERELVPTGSTSPMIEDFFRLNSGGLMIKQIVAGDGEEVNFDAKQIYCKFYSSGVMTTNNYSMTLTNNFTDTVLKPSFIEAGAGISIDDRYDATSGAQIPGIKISGPTATPILNLESFLTNLNALGFMEQLHFTVTWADGKQIYGVASGLNASGSSGMYTISGMYVDGSGMYPLFRVQGGGGETTISYYDPSVGMNTVVIPSTTGVTDENMYKITIGRLGS